jgi:hypothetical protein
MKKIESNGKKISLHKETITLLNKGQTTKEQGKTFTGKSIRYWCGTSN